MRVVESCDAYFLKMADHVATRSKDPNTQVGCVIVGRGNQVLSTGYNGMPPGVDETPELWSRPAKYDFVIHAEQNAVARAARLGIALDGSTAYVTRQPCQECAKALIAGGIRRVVFWVVNHQGWEESYQISQAAFSMSGVRTEPVEPPHDEEKLCKEMLAAGATACYCGSGLPYARCCLYE